MKKFSFEILKESKKSNARLGKVITPHGEFETPMLFFVASKGAVKTLSSLDLKELGVKAIMCNTFHLYLQPGADTIAKLGGLHRFMNWSGPLATDSGGFQVFSLGWGKVHGVGKVAKIFPGENFEVKSNQKPKLVKITKEGVWFTSYLDGKKHFFSPEKSVEIQEKLGADIIFAFDECTSPLSDYQYTKEALKRTHEWAWRCLKAKKRKDQALMGIVQGGEYKDLRIESAKFISSLPFDGFAIGGSLGKSKKDMFKILDWTVPLLPKEKPRHLLGVGEVEDLIACIKKGIDMFDCVIPTRLARHGVALTKRGKMNIKKSVFKTEKKPIEKNCQCLTCQNFSLGYLHHLFKTKETLGPRLLTIHNLYFVNKLMEKMRKLILQGLV